MGIFDWKHWLVIALVVILVFGTKKLKNLGSDLGEAIKGFRKSMNTEEEKAPEAPSVANTLEGQAHKVQESVPNERERHS